MSSRFALYFINGRYYSPLIKQYLSPVSLEAMITNALIPYGLNRYLLTLDNPINMGYTGHTIATNADLAYDPKEESNWTVWWMPIQRWFGKALNWYNDLHWGWKVGVGVGLFLVGLGLTMVTGGAALPFIISFGIGVAVGTAIGTGINMAMGANFGDALLDGFADSVLISGVFSFASGVIRASKYAYAWVTKNAEIMAKMFTHNAHAATVMLGHGDRGAVTGYVAQAKAGGHTYFAMSQKQMAKLATRFGGDIWEINRAFLLQQIAQNKAFVFSHAIPRVGSYFAREMNFLFPGFNF